MFRFRMIYMFCFLISSLLLICKRSSDGVWWKKRLIIGCSGLLNFEWGLSE